MSNDLYLQYRRMLADQILSDPSVFALARSWNVDREMLDYLISLYREGGSCGFYPFSGRPDDPIPDLALLGFTTSLVRSSPRPDRDQSMAFGCMSTLFFLILSLVFLIVNGFSVTIVAFVFLILMTSFFITCDAFREELPEPPEVSAEGTIIRFRDAESLYRAFLLAPDMKFVSEDSGLIVVRVEKDHEVCESRPEKQAWWSEIRFPRPEREGDCQPQGEDTYLDRVWPDPACGVAAGLPSPRTQRRP